MRRVLLGYAVIGLLTACAASTSSSLDLSSRPALSSPFASLAAESVTPTPEPTPTPIPPVSPSPRPPATPLPTPDLVADWVLQMQEILQYAADITADTRAISQEFARCDFSHLSTFNAQHFDGREAVKTMLSRLPPPTPETQELTVMLFTIIELEIQADVPRSTAAMLELYDNPSVCTGGDTNSLDADAHAAKVEFVSVYNPIAEQYGLRTWSADDF